MLFCYKVLKMVVFGHFHHSKAVFLSLSLCLSLSLSLFNHAHHTISPSLFPTCRYATILLFILSCCQSILKVVARQLCGCGSGGMRVVGCGLGGLWVLLHGFLLGCGVVQWLWCGSGMAMGLGWVVEL